MMQWIERIRVPVAVAAMMQMLVVLPVTAGEIRGLPFWGQPYPAYYAYKAPPPSCWVYERVPFLFGYRMERVWICGQALSVRY